MISWASAAGNPLRALARSLDVITTTMSESESSTGSGSFLRTAAAGTDTAAAFAATIFFLSLPFLGTFFTTLLALAFSFSLMFIMNLLLT
jgi:hypothetical protein